MKPVYNQVDIEEPADRLQQERDFQARRLELRPGQWFLLNYGGAHEPDDDVLLVRLCGRVFRFSKCESIQLVFLIFTILLMSFVIFGSIFETNSRPALANN